MSVTSMFTAVSGMNTNAISLGVVGDNIANMNTHGFKSSSVVFADIVSSQGGSNSIGRGSRINEVGQEFSQGAFENTPNVLDMAIDGDGLFVVKKSGNTFYTRAGQFGIDKTGYAVNPDGFVLQGYQFDVTGNASTVVDDVNVAQASLGAEIRVPALVGERMVLVPPGIQSGTMLRLKGEGIKNSRSQGDELIQVNVRTPEKLTQKEKKLIQELAKEFEAKKLSYR